jgi:hypothetical protein
VNARELGPSGLRSFRELRSLSLAHRQLDHASVVMRANIRGSQSTSLDATAFVATHCRSAATGALGPDRVGPERSRVDLVAQKRSVNGTRLLDREFFSTGRQLSLQVTGYALSKPSRAKSVNLRPILLVFGLLYGIAFVTFNPRKGCEPCEVESSQRRQRFSLSSARGIAVEDPDRVLRQGHRQDRRRPPLRSPATVVRGRSRRIQPTSVGRGSCSETTTASFTV